MKGKRYKEEQIIRILQEAEASVAVADICRKHNRSEQSFYRWKAKYGKLEYPILNPIHPTLKLIARI